MSEVETKIETKIETKPWWESRAQVGALVSTATIVLALAGIPMDAAVLTETVLLVGGLIGNLVSMWGTMKRKQPLDQKQILPNVFLP